LNEVGIFAFPKEWHTPRIPGFGDIDWGKFMGLLYEIHYSGPLCIEVEDDTFGKSLAGRQNALAVARNVLAPFIQS
jgi:sugar phosphate isomerase/epimerase